jgi:hypothetical protein
MAVLLTAFASAAAGWAETITWTGSAGNDSWHAAGNWDLNRLPAAGDDVVIPAGDGAVTFDTGSTTINSLSSARAFTQNGGSLWISTVATLEGPFTWTAGNLYGPGVVNANGGITLSGYSQKWIRNWATVNNAGLAIYSNGSGNLIIDQGVWNNLDDAVFEVRNSTFIGDGGSRLGTFNNYGTFRKVSGGETRFWNLPNFNNYGRVDIQAGFLSVMGMGYNQMAGETVLNGGNLNTYGTTVGLQGGALCGIGTVTGHVNNSGGTVRPGASPGALTISGVYTQQAGGTLDIEVGGYTPGTDFDRLVVGDTAVLAGTLHATLLNGFEPLPADQFQFLSAGGRAGTFSATIPCNDTVTYTTTAAALSFDRQPPAISDQPDAASVTVGRDATLAVAAGGVGSLTFRWRKDGVDLVDGPTPHGSVISGAATAILTVGHAQVQDEGLYDCVVTDDCAAGASSAAALAVQTKGNLNCDGDVDANDIDPFVLALADPATYQAVYAYCDLADADCNGDGLVDFGDINAFVALLSGQ